MSMGTLKYWSIGKYIIHCHLLYLRKLIFNNKQFISQNTIVCFRAMAAYEEKVPVAEQAKERYPISEDIKHCLPFLGNYCEK